MPRCGECIDPLNEIGGRIKRLIKKEMEMTPFDYDKKWKPKKGYKDGWIYISIIKSIPRLKARGVKKIFYMMKIPQ